MKQIRLILFVSFVLCLYISCKPNTSKEEMVSLVKMWDEKQIVYPSRNTFTIYGEDTLSSYVKSGVEYSIVSYIDSLGCLSCKLQAKAWKDFRKTIDSVSKSAIPVNLFIHYRDAKELFSLLKKENFDIPVCLDLDDSLRILNDFPEDVAFRTFLLNKENRVVAIGNPVFNPRVKELYLKIIQGETISRRDEAKAIQTELFIDKRFIDLGRFDWNKEQKATFTLKNTGNKPLVIQTVNTSCGCTTVTYSEEPVQPGGETALEVVYKADYPEHLNKSITVYCNAESSPITLKITGNAK